MTNVPSTELERGEQHAHQFAQLGCALLNDAAPDDTFMIDIPVVNRTPGLTVAGPVAPVITADDMLPCLQLLEAAHPGEVLYIQNRAAGPSEALAGDIFLTAMRSHGLRGLVVDGAVRDTAELQTIGLPVFSTEVTFLSARTAERAVHDVPCAVEVPIRRAGASHIAESSTAIMSPGDWLFADGDGLMFVPRRRVSAVIGAALLLAEREAELKAALASGGRMGELCGLDGYLAGDSKLRFSF